MFQVLKVRLIKICKIEPPDILFLVVFITFYISRYHFSQIFRTHSVLSVKKILVTNFNPLSVMKFFCRCSLRHNAALALITLDLKNGKNKVFAF